MTCQVVRRVGGWMETEDERTGKNVKQYEMKNDMKIFFSTI